ncbi:MAG: hypothetical protein HY814_06385, partial [Candidatus Riflebacteria bacterium]|nr:hypothetical protein [Candidatus Riflebacteria bacterium]
MKPALVLALLWALIVPSSSPGGEAEELADRYLETRQYSQALRYYRKALRQRPDRDVLWDKYDAALRASLLASGELVRPSTAPASVTPAPLSPPDSVSVRPPPSSQGDSPATSPSTTPAPSPTPQPDPVGPIVVPGPPTYRPGERVPSSDPAAPAAFDPAVVIDGGQFRVEQLAIGYDATGAVQVRGQLTASGNTILNRPLVFVSIFDKQDALQGRTLSSLLYGRFSLAPGQSGQ